MWIFSILTAPSYLEISLVIDSFLGLVWELNSVLLNFGLCPAWVAGLYARTWRGETVLCEYRAIV